MIKTFSLSSIFFFSALSNSHPRFACRVPIKFSSFFLASTPCLALRISHTPLPWPLLLALAQQLASPAKQQRPQRRSAADSLAKEREKGGECARNRWSIPFSTCIASRKKCGGGARPTQNSTQPSLIHVHQIRSNEQQRKKRQRR